ncbi:MAG: transcription antitermination factor NusB [Clostridiaceae bacterium]|nr:transcription antitermination factor NusB [Clostridiaceae bacterium]
MSRKTAREKAFRLIFEYSVNSRDVDEMLEDDYEVDEEDDGDINSILDRNDLEYITDVVRGTFANLDKIDSLIKECIVGWDFDRLAKVTLAVLRLALYELLFREDIPVKVIINEAIEIAKKYQGEKAAPFINGALGAAAEKVRK